MTRCHTSGTSNRRNALDGTVCLVDRGAKCLLCSFWVQFVSCLRVVGAAGPQFIRLFQGLCDFLSSPQNHSFQSPWLTEMQFQNRWTGHPSVFLKVFYCCRLGCAVFGRQPAPPPFRAIVAPPLMYFRGGGCSSASVCVAAT